MVRHRWEQRTDTVAGPAPRARFRFRLGRGAIMCLLFTAVIWIAASLLFHPPEGSGERLGAVDMDPSASTATASGSQGPPSGASTAPETEPQTSSSSGSTAAEADAGSATSAAATVLVHVAGAVKKPGVYRFAPGARAQDAVRSAGGLSAGAAPAAVNLAAPLVDGQQLYLPTAEELPAAGGTLQAPPPGQGPGEGAGEGVGGVAPTGKTININTADATALQEIPGIGPALSARILEFRTANGPFSSLAEIDAVSGIGPAMLARLEPMVRFN